MKKILLAFSGGLDTCFCVLHLIEQGYEVSTVTVDTGGFSSQELIDLQNKSASLGAIQHYQIDAQQDLYEKFATYIIKANYLKGGVYPACVSPERIIIAEKIVEIAKKQNINIIAHGSTGAGNDQVRFDLALKALMPDCQIITPIREHEFDRNIERKILQEKGFIISQEVKDYSINQGLLGTTIGGKETYDSKLALPDDVFPTVKSIYQSISQVSSVKLQFSQGLPVALNGQYLSGVEIIKQLNQIGAINGFGKDYHIGTTIIGIKARLGFEAPALKIIIKAHSELEKLILTSKQLFWKNHLGNVYGDLIHEALYYDPLIKDLEAFFDSASQNVTGEVQLELYKGNLNIVSMQSAYSLLGQNGTYGEKTGVWTGQDAAGFCQLYGMESVKAFQLNH